MYEWNKLIQAVVDEIDRRIAAGDSEALTLRALSEKLGYSGFYTTHKFREIAGMPLRDYLRQRRMAFALKAVRDSADSLLDIAVRYGFSSHEALSRRSAPARTRSSATPPRVWKPTARAASWLTTSTASPPRTAFSPAAMLLPARLPLSSPWAQASVLLPRWMSTLRIRTSKKVRKTKGLP